MDSTFAESIEVTNKRELEKLDEDGPVLEVASLLTLPVTNDIISGHNKMTD
jgi:hypothetical protein